MTTNADLLEIPQSEQTVFNGLLIHVNHMQVTLPNGQPAMREIVSHNGGAAIVPVDADENLYMVRQHRIAVDEMTLEIPAGKLEYRGADFRDAAIRELEEETGLRAEHVELLTSAFPTPGYCNEILGIYLATGLSQHEDHPDADEFLHVEKLPLKEAVARVMTGEFRDAKTIIGILMAWYHLHGYETPSGK
ncbi:MAG: NUDIX hydrolase [Clostridia bacterium]|nr:NUDIX hydrolase [Clostridia bacterium]